MTEENIALMKRDISCNAKKISDIQEEFKKRDPAKETYNFMNKVTVDLALMKKEQQDMKMSFDDFKRENDNQHQELKTGISDIRKLIVRLFWVVGGGAVLIILFYILNHVGLTGKFQ